MTLLCSMHIEKTGGKSLLELYRAHYAAADVLDVGHDAASRHALRAAPKTDPRKASVRVVHGHLPWGFHAWFGRPYIYVAFVRDPVERVVSFYEFVRRDPTHDRHALANELDLAAWIERDPDRSVDNAQTRYFAGRITEYAPRSVDVIEHDRPAMLEEAIENIRHDFAVVGVLEHAAASVEMLAVYFDWRAEVPLPRRNAGPPRAPLDPGLRARILERNQLDQALYEYSVAKLERDYPVFCGRPLR